MALAPKLAEAIEARLKRVGDFGALKLIVKHGRVDEYEVVSSERVKAGEAGA